MGEGARKGKGKKTMCEACGCRKNGPIQIGIMIGSDNDLKQCLDGLLWLAGLLPSHAMVHPVITNSIHRNTLVVLENLETYNPDVWIIGAGMANHLTGTADAYLRYMLERQTPVIGVAFRGKTEEDTLAAILSIEKVPGTQVIFDRKLQVGSEGFEYACKLAYKGEFPEIKIPEGKLVRARALDQAIEAAKKLVEESTKR